MISRRQALWTTGLTLWAPMINRGRYRIFAANNREYSKRTINLIQASVVIDMQSTPSLNVVTRMKWLTRPETFAAGDLKEFKDSGINVFNWSPGYGGPDAYMTALGIVGATNSFLAHNSEAFKRIDSVVDIDIARRTSRIGVIVGLQNSEHFRTLPDIAAFYGLGQRLSQLTYNSRNFIGSGSTERRDDGLSDFGVAVVGQMNSIGMAVDVSHCGDRTTLDAFEASKLPVLITHSNCRALVNGHPRCKSDEAIRAIAKTGGVMGISSMRMFVKADEPTTIANVIDHYDHVARLVGIEYAGVGSDIDLHGGDAIPSDQKQAAEAQYKSTYRFREKLDIEGLNHPRRMFDLTEALLSRGYNDRDVRGILGANFQRALGQIWKAQTAN